MLKCFLNHESRIFEDKFQIFSFLKIPTIEVEFFRIWKYESKIPENWLVFFPPTSIDSKNSSLVVSKSEAFES